MKFVKLDITNKTLGRVDFIGQANSLFVLPDNLPDFRLARNELETSENRGGLAAVMRPNKVGQMDGIPLYDVNIVGVPTLSFDGKEPLTTKHITEAFVGIYRLLNLKNFNQLVVPYKNGKPAFGGGVAGAIPAVISNAIDAEFIRLEQFLTKRDITKLPKEYQAALLEGPLPVKRIPQKFVERVFNKAYPKASIVGRLTLSIAVASGIYTALHSLLIAHALLLTAFAGGAFMLAFVGSSLLLKRLFGEQTAQFKINDNRDWALSHKSVSDGLVEMVGVKFPYKVRLAELETQLSQQLGNKEKNPQFVKILTTRFAREIVNSHSENFYREDLDKVNSANYFKKLK